MTSPLVSADQNSNNDLVEIHGRVAQWIRHLTTNQGIPGSSPGMVETFETARIVRIIPLESYLVSCSHSWVVLQGISHPTQGRVAQWIRHLTTNQGIPGSSPGMVESFLIQPFTYKYRYGHGQADMNQKWHERKTDHDGDRTHNLPIRSRTPYPLGHAADSKFEFSAKVYSFQGSWIFFTLVLRFRCSLI